MLRGPQGTLFGRNTSGGAVNMITKDPSNTFGLDEKAGYGGEDGWFTRTTLNTGYLGGSTIKATVSYMHRDRDGWVDNPYASSANDPGSLHSDAVWVKVRGDFGENFSVVNAFDYDTLDGQPEGFQMVAMSPAVKAYFSQSPLFGGDPLVLSGKRLDTLPLAHYPYQADTQHSATIGDSLTAKYDFNDEVSVKSITGYRHWYASEPTSFGADFKGLVLNLANNGVSVQQVETLAGQQDVSQYQVSQEAQLTWKTDRWNTVGGLYYFYEHVREDNPNYFTFVIPTGIPNPAYLGLNFDRTNAGLKYRENSASYAAYGQTSYKPPI